MSSTVIKRGFIVALKTAMTREEREDWNERLSDAESGLHINHEGTLVYSNTVPYAERENIYGLQLGHTTDDAVDFYIKLQQFGIEIVFPGRFAYTEIYHNSGDSAISMLTLNVFQKKLEV